MTKRLIEAAQAVLEDAIRVYNGSGPATELEAALDEARKPVEVTQDQSMELGIIFVEAIGEEVNPEGRDCVTEEENQEIQAAFTAVLQKAKELGL